MWVLDVRLDQATRTVSLYAIDRATNAVHIAALELLTVAATRTALALLIDRHGRPDSIMTDHGALFAGMGEGLGIEHFCPSHPNNLAWIERMLRRAA